MKASSKIKNYFDDLHKRMTKAHDLADKARHHGFDPEDSVDIKLANNMAERVEGLISVVAPQLVGTKLTKRIEQLEKEYGTLAWEVALVIAAEVAQEKFCKFKDKREAMEVGIRTGFAYHTLGIVAAPLEGFTELKLKKRRDGKEYFAIFFSGPVRGAGGTAVAVCVVIADYVRKVMGYEPYDPDEMEVKRYYTELEDYHERITNLQYHPSEQEDLFLASHLPIEVNGDPTEDLEVSNYKDLTRVETNRIRGGVCLAVSMIALKAPKLWKRMSKWKDKFVDWSFLEEFLKLQKQVKAKDSVKVEEVKLAPDFTFISDLVAGRPVLSFPLAKGGFRLRYGRSRLSGYSAACMHPASMELVNRYVATGTQLKMERPGKAAAISPCDSIEGPVVKLNNGNVVFVNSQSEAKQLFPEIEEVIFLGDVLFNYGDFSENGHKLVPPGYCEEWWAQNVEKALVDSFGVLDFEKSANFLGMQVSRLTELVKNPLKTKPSASESLLLSKQLKVPLHPLFTYHFSDIEKDDFLHFYEWLGKADVRKENSVVKKVILPLEEKSKRVLELLGVPHIVASNEFVVISGSQAVAFSSVLLEQYDFESFEAFLPKCSVLDCVNEFSSVKVMDKSGTFIGARMGRPEKAKMRKLTGSPHGLFPVGSEGGRLRSFQSALEAGKINAEFPIKRCEKCDNETIYPICEKCGRKTVSYFYCRQCGVVKECEHNPFPYTRKDLDINHYFKQALQTIGTNIYPDLIKGVRGTSNKDHSPEHLVKAILRAKYDIFVNKDGTIRYDMSELPITHFRPKEVRTGVEKLKELGYHKDVDGNPLENDGQLLELLPQDVVLPACDNSGDEPCDDVLFRICQFVDDLLVNFYKEKPFYNLKSKDDLVGQLVIGLAPHISAGTIGRIVGFSRTQGFYAHPMYHAALRRDCDGDEACVIMLMDAFLNFSKSFLPDRRGGRTMDAPLVLTTVINPAEVDDMVLGLDCVKSYPLAFYEAALEYKNPWDIEIEQLKVRLGEENQFEDFYFTHDVSDVNIGVRASAYKLLPSMEEKLLGQMEIAERLRAVNTSKVAGLVIEKHFLKDIKGNLRKFSQQQFRCVNCNEKFRRPPLVGKCTSCNGKIIFTIHEGSVVKYMEPCMSLARKYEQPPYLVQTLELTKRRIEDVFGKDKEKQEGLGKWFG